MDNILVTNIQRFSLHDGPGIRTTVFLKGCSLHCPWCCNPETIAPVSQNYSDDGHDGTYGFWITTDMLYQELIKDEVFYNKSIQTVNISSVDQLDRLPGGVTFSGGEALLQIHKIEKLLQKLKDNHIHTAIETSLFAPQNCVRTAIAYIDLFYVDIKILDQHDCRQFLGGDLNQYLANLDIVLASGKPIVFRIPVIGSYTDGFSNKQKVINLIKNAKGNVLKVEVIKEHNLALKKYHTLICGGNDVSEPEYHGVDSGALNEYIHMIRQETKLPVELCKI